jgi:hypothetical protein
MKRVLYALLLLLVVVSGIVLANHPLKPETVQQPTPTPRSTADAKADLKRWEASPDGVHFNNWKASPQGQKVLAGAAKLNKQINDFTYMEAVVTNLTLPPGSRLGFGIMVKINGEDYILSFGPETSDEFKTLHGLKVNDTIMIKSHAVSYAPKYAYPIVAGNQVEQGGKIIYKRTLPKDGC